MPIRMLWFVVFLPACSFQIAHIICQTATNGRIHAWNHNVPPDYLRTKPENSVIMNESAIVDTMSARTPDQINVRFGNLCFSLLFVTETNCPNQQTHR
jgi:hypothetical protein